MYYDQPQFQLAPLQSAAISRQALQSPSMGANYTSVYGGNAPQFGGVGQGGFSLGNIFGENGASNLGLGLGALQTLGGLWNSYNTSKLAKESLSLQKRAFETNLENNTQSYNTALEDRIRSRYATEGRSDQADSYIDKHSL